MRNMRFKVIAPSILVASLLLGGAASAVNNSGRSQKAVNDRKAEFDKAPKTHMGDEVLVAGVWRNCRFHLVRLPAQRESATLPNGDVVESLRVMDRAPDAMAAQLPERDPACDNVEPSREQIDANRADIDAENERLNPGRRSAVPGR